MSALDVELRRTWDETCAGIAPPCEQLSPERYHALRARMEHRAAARAACRRARAAHLELAARHEAARFCARAAASGSLTDFFDLGDALRASIPVSPPPLFTAEGSR